MVPVVGGDLLGIRTSPTGGCLATLAVVTPQKSDRSKSGMSGEGRAETNEMSAAFGERPRSAHLLPERKQPVSIACR